MHDRRMLTQERVERALRERIRPAVVISSVPLEITVNHLPGEPIPALEAIAGEFVPARAGDRWGPPWGTSWFHVTGRVPAEWSGGRVAFRADLGFSGGPGFQAEGLVYRPDGVPVKGIEPDNTELLIAERAAGGEVVDYYLEAAANPPVIEQAFRPTDLGDVRTAPRDPLYVLTALELIHIDETVRALGHDVDVLLGLARALPENSARGGEILHVLARMLDDLDTGEVADGAARARETLKPLLAAPADHGAHRVSAVGHAHIDSAWLWPIRETVRKCARTFANVTSLAEQYPELRFACSQAQQYAWIRDAHPDLFARIRAAVTAGTFVPVGGMWVESDTNMPGGEALARQFVQGQRFFRQEFGITCREVWLPDSFGFTAALPQIATLAGMNWFLTQKLAYNETNRFPHNTFWWEGIDGTRIFSHYPPVENYNAELVPADLAFAAERFTETGAAGRSLVAFGHGDGGGGPTGEMLERARRQADLAGSPEVAVQTPAEFFTAAQAEYPDAPVWVGELYLESHRGTYTSQALMKQGNRRSEHLLREVELWAATAARRGLADYPYEELERLWRTVLLHQFHDILPGSSIAWVHREARETYRRVIAELEVLRDAAQRALAGTGDRELTFNATPHPWAGVPALGAAETGDDGAPVTVTREPDRIVLDNGLVRVGIDGRGLVRSVRDLTADREIVPAGTAANLLQLHPDRPNTFDAWNVDEFYRNRVEDLTTVESLNVEGTVVRVRRSFGSSSAVQTITLAPGSRTVEFGVEVDWRERDRFLKVAVPIDVHTDRATAEIQYGHLTRPTHANTTWDAARFEVCAHRFVHVGEPGYGAAVVNDSTYGHDVTRTLHPGGGTYSTVRLSLLRAPRYPDPDTDQGAHGFRYGLVCGADLGAAVRAGYRMNLPRRTLSGGGPVEPEVVVDDPAVVVEAVKLADDRSGDLIVRLYESRGARARATVSVRTPGPAVETDLLEEPRPDGRSFGAGGPIVLELRPFEIVTLRFASGGQSE
ncbi:alpha-mannosidase [Actinoallomurus soli]|uniref:alpha-mannosidase n=1 Tax=Actinoallomurus soli TaxID=2952535 RepID=UPI002093359F|nr:glycoside hydrolase family 38 C-terminal domain-containing protein [Actinoallomurus soli]MCO5970576.1 glycosyl hydrolase-related protein [Actinoallomurus soli]